MTVTIRESGSHASGIIFAADKDQTTPKPKGLAGVNPRVEGAAAPLILVVDDDVANLQLAEAVLEADGFRVIVATDAHTTLEALKACEPAVILMDIQLPGMDGWTLTQRLKTIDAIREIPIVALTAYGRIGDEERAREAGFVEFVSKPVSTRDLSNIVRKHLRATFH